MKKVIKKTSLKWVEDMKNPVVILDPDGWDRKNYHYSFCVEKITKKEFERRLVYSTIMGTRGDVFSI